MSPDLPFDIIPLIIDIVGENKDTDLLKELALVSHSFHAICSKHLFAIVHLYSATPLLASSKKGFVKLLKSRPEIVKYIRKLTYNVECNEDDDDHLLSSILLYFLPTFSRLDSLEITASGLDWGGLNPSLKSIFLNLMHLPTINHIKLSHIQNFPLSSLTQSMNLLRLDIDTLNFSRLLEDASPEIVVEMMPKIREFETLWSTRVTTNLLNAKTRDGRPAFNFMDLRRFSTRMNGFEDKRNVRHLLQNAKLLENLELLVGRGQNLMGLLSRNARTLKVLDLSVSLWGGHDIVLGGIYEELKAMAGHNMLEAFKLCTRINYADGDSEVFIGFILRRVRNLLVKPGWSGQLRQVSFKLEILV